MLAAADIIAVLAVDLCDNTIAAVEGAGALPEAADQVQASGTAFVLPPGEKAIENDAGTGAIRQSVSVGFEVLLIFTGIGPRGEDKTGDVDAAREGVKNALLGKLLADMKDPITLVSANVAEIDAAAGTLIYSLVFATGYHIRRNA